MFVFVGAEAEISLEMALDGHYQGKLCHREIDLIEVLPPPVSEKHMRELSGLPSIEGGNDGSSGPTSPSRPAVGVVSLVHSPVPASSGMPAGVHVEKGNALIWKRQILHVVPSSYEET